MSFFHMSKEMYTDGERYFGIISYTLKDDKTRRFQLFYRSSGANSIGGTWFPIDGYLMPFDTKPESYFSKVNKTKFASQFRKEPYEPRVSTLFHEIQQLGISGMRTEKDIKEKLFLRFGAPVFILISSLLGGGLWALYPELGHIIFQFLGIEHTISPKHPPYDISGHTIQHLRDEKTLNMFCRDAISVNYLKEEYDENTINAWVDYGEWYTKEISVGASSQMNKTLKRFGMKEISEKKSLCITFKTRLYIPEIFVYMNLDTIQPESVDQIKKRLLVFLNKTSSPPTTQSTS